MSHAGLVGLGLLGSAMAERLLQAGHTLTGYDISESARQSFERNGGNTADSVRRVFEECSVVVISLPDSQIVRSVMTEAMPALSGQLVIDTTTGDPQDSADLGRMLAEHGSRYVDATVLGSSEQTRQGQVVVMAGGTDEAWQQALPWLTCFSFRQFHTGGCGSGATAKLIVNLVLGLNRAVLAEGLNLAEQCGVNLPMILEILKSGAAYSKVMDIKGEKMISAEFSPQARLNQHWKDVRLILDLGAQHAARLPLSEVHEGLLRRASELGFGDMDNSAIIRAFQS